tara:strand:+ start:14133 stop:15476 length:1344 start_codon:yes stop_codon:yes gene_type:complete
MLAILEYEADCYFDRYTPDSETRKKALDHDSTAPEPPEFGPWTSISKQKWSRELIELFEARTIYTAGIRLQDLGLIEVIDQGNGQPCLYRLNIAEVNVALNELRNTKLGKKAKVLLSGKLGKNVKVPEKSSAKMQRSDFEARQKCVGSTAAYNKVFKTLVKPDIGNTETPETLSESPLSPQDQNLPLPEESQEPESTPLPYSGGPLPGDDITEEAISESDLALEDDIATFVTQCYSRERRIRLKKADLKNITHKLESLESSHSPEDFRRALLNFLAEDSEWLRTNKWPINAFMKDPLRYMTQSPRSPRQSGGYSASPIAYRSAGTSEASTGAPTASPQNTSDPILQFVDKWNTINPDHPVGELLAATKAKLRAATSDPDFVRVHEKLFEKVGKFMAAGQDIEFPWMFAGKEPNWVRTMEGVFNFFLVKKGPAGGGVDMDRLIQEAGD